MARDDDLMMTAEELRLKRLRRRRLIVLVLVLVIMIAGAIFGGRPTLNAIKAWQARRHAEKAFAYIAQEKWTEARGEAVTAYRLRPTEPEAIRAVARFLSRTRQPDALEFWKQLQDRQSLTREDLRDEAAIALAAGDMPRADEAVTKLISAKAEPARQPEAADWLLAAQLSIQKGVPEDARKSLEKVFDDAKATEREQFQAILFELATSQNQDQVNEAWARLEKLSHAQSAIGLESLVVLARRAVSRQMSEDSGQTSAVTDLARALEAHPLAKTPQKLLALDLLANIDPAQREQLIARGIADWKDADAESLAVLAAWLNGKGEFQKTLETVPLEKALKARDLFLQYLDALGALGRWSEIKELLENERYPLEQVVQRMYLARCNAQLGEKTSAENNWKRALEAAGGDPGKLLTLAEYAEKNGNLAVAESAYATAAIESPKLRPAFQGRLRMAQASRETRKIHAVLAEMLRLWPNDSAVQNDEAHLRLLLMPSQSQRSDVRGQTSEPITDNEELITIEQLAAKLVQREPASLPHRTLLALARLRQNRPAEALEVYSNIQVPANAATPSALAIHAAVLAANGKIDDAKTEAAQIKIDNLLQEEKQLIQDLL